MPKKDERKFPDKVQSTEDTKGERQGSKVR